MREYELSPEEPEIIRLLVDGPTTRRIAQALNVSPTIASGRMGTVVHKLEGPPDDHGVPMPT